MLRVAASQAAWRSRDRRLRCLRRADAAWDRGGANSPDVPDPARRRGFGRGFGVRAWRPGRCPAAGRAGLREEWRSPPADPAATAEPAAERAAAGRFLGRLLLHEGRLGRGVDPEAQLTPRRTPRWAGFTHFGGACNSRPRGPGHYLPIANARARLGQSRGTRGFVRRSRSLRTELDKGAGVSHRAFGSKRTIFLRS